MYRLYREASAFITERIGLISLVEAFPSFRNTIVQDSERILDRVRRRTFRVELYSETLYRAVERYLQPPARFGLLLYLGLQYIAGVYDFGVLIMIITYYGSVEYGLVGATGRGKSSLMSLLLGQEAPTAGAIYFLNTDNRVAETRVAASIVYLSQHAPILNGDLTDNITLGGADTTNRLQHVIEAVGLSELRTRKFGIVISHNADVIDLLSDRVVYIPGDGTPLTGTHAELARDDSSYRAILNVAAIAGFGHV